MLKFRLKKHRFTIIALLAMSLFFLSSQPADAWCASMSGCIQEGIGSLFSLLFSIVGMLIGALAKGLNEVLYMRVFPDGGIAVVSESWKIMRNFANMFFIVALIVMSFATIFNISKYEARTLFPKFLISALLINFSMVIGVLIIDASQVLNNVFLTAIGNMSNRLGETMVQHIGTLLPGQDALSQVSQSGTGTVVFTAIVQLIFLIILLFSFLFSLLTAFLFAFIRIPILWALLVVSPMAWMLNIFPAGQATYKKWWSTFIGWNMFLPIFLFFLYFSLLFLQNQGEVISSISAETENQSLLEGVKMPIQVIFYYVLASIFLIGGTITAMKASMFSGTGVVGVAKWSRAVAARRLGLTAANQAWQEKKAQIQGGEGTLGKYFGGPPPGLGRARNILGVRGADFKTQKDFLDRANKEFETVQSQYDIGKISADDVQAKAGQGNASNPQSFAYRRMAAKLGRLDNDVFHNTLRDLSNNPLAASDFVKVAKEAKFSNLKGGELLDASFAEGRYGDLDGVGNLLPARKEIIKHLPSDPVASGMLSAPRFQKGLSLLGGHTTADGKEFIKEIGKASPDFIMDYNLSDPELKKVASEGFQKSFGAPPANDFQLRTYMLGASLKKGEKEVANINLRVWKIPEFQEALKIYVSQMADPVARKRYVTRLQKALGDTFAGDQKIEILRGNPTTGLVGVVNSATYGAAVPRPTPPSGTTAPI